MRCGIHFISGLPRSGSTLLAAILRQNPMLHAGMSSPVAPLYQALYVAMGAGSDTNVFINEEQRISVLRGVFENYYRTIGETKTIIDTNRMWCAKIDALALLFPDARIIACVRDPVRIFDSFERLYRESPLLLSKMYTAEQAATVQTRVDALGGVSGVRGYAWHALRDAYYSANAHKLVLVDYDALVRTPAHTIRALYSRLRWAPYEHDFENIEFEAANEFDARLGAPGLHKVRSKVRAEERKSTLPPDLASRWSNDAFWTNPAVLRKDVAIIGLSSGR